MKNSSKFLIASCMLFLYAPSAIADVIKPPTGNLKPDEKSSIVPDDNAQYWTSINLQQGNEDTTTLTIDTTNYGISAKDVTMNGKNLIQFTPAVNNIIFENLTVSNQNNTVEHSADSNGTVEIEKIKLNTNANLNLTSNNGKITFQDITLEDGNDGITTLTIDSGGNLVEKARIISNGLDTSININNTLLRDSYQENLNGGTISTKGTLNITDSSFINNTSKANGGAIYSEGEVIINATNKDVVFSGNSGTLGNDIYLANGTDLRLNTSSGKTISFDGGIEGTTGSDIYLDGSGRVILDTTAKNANIHFYGGEFVLTHENNFDSVNMEVDNSLSEMSGTAPALNVINNSTGTVTIPALSINGQMKLKIDADIAHNISDKVLSAIPGVSQGNVYVSNINLLSDAQSSTVRVLDTAGSHTLSVNPEMTLVTSNYVYNVTASGKDLTFTRGTALDGFQSSVQSINGERYLSMLKDENIVYDYRNPQGTTTPWTGEMGTGELTIYANGHSLNGSSLFSGIKVDGQSILNIYDFGTESNPVTHLAAESGAVISNLGTANISTSYFHDNVATTNGGVISNAGNLTVFDSVFTENTSSGGSGGAIYNIANISSLRNGNFSKNTAINGGAIYNSGSINITGDSFTATENEANYGGALYNVSNDKVHFDIPSVSFTSNKAKLLGGAIANYAGEMTFNGTTISHDGTVNYATVRFADNTAKNSGGAIYNTGETSLITSDANWTVERNRDENGTTIGGGAIGNFNGATINLEGSNSFDANYTNFFGGAILNDGANISMGSVKTFYIPATPADPSGCGEGTPEITRTIYTSHNFTNNESKKGGGAVANTNNANLSITAMDTFWAQNKAWESGSAIYNKNNSLVKIDTINENTFYQNSGERCGGAIYNETAKFTMETSGNNNFVCNDSGLCGGAIFNTNEGDMYIYAFGGGYSEYNNAPGNYFFQNIANTNGGAILNKDSYIYLATGLGGLTTFEENEGAVGGAIYAKNDIIDTSKVNVRIGGDADFIKNKASSGGAIGSEHSNVFIDDNSVFNENIAATGDGGAIYGIENSTIKLVDTSFDKNNAYWSGGAIYLSDSVMEITMGASFTNNSTKINTYDYDDLFDGGGAIQLNDSHMTINGATSFKNNTANGSSASGGAVNVIGATDDASFTIDADFNFENNKASYLGGAIYAGANKDHRAVINLTSHTKSSFKGNTAAGENNAIYLERNAEVNLYNTRQIEPLTGKEYYSDIVFEDKIAGGDENNLIVQHNGNVYYKNDNRGYRGDFTLHAGDAYFTEKASYFFNGGNYVLDAGSKLHLNNGRIDEIPAKSLTAGINGKAIIDIDLDLTTELSDRFVLEKSATGNILVDKIDVTGDTQKESIFYDIAKGADFDTNVKEIKARLYKYKVKGIKSGLLLYRDASGGEGSLVNTAVLGPSIAVNAYLAGQLANYNQLLARVDEIAEYRYFDNVGGSKKNLYAAATDIIDDTVSPTVYQGDRGTVWVKPSITVENISPEGHSGYKNRAYNTFLGYDFPVANLRNGWELVNTVFGGYQGSYQDYDNIQNYQNGGYGGYMANIYKNNFFAGAVVTAGGTAVQTKDDGHDGYDESMDFALFNVGAAAKVGYNIGLGKHWLFQPLFNTSYTFISGYNTTNNAGENTHAKGTNTISISPGFKLIGNFKGWQPYVLLNYNWPLMAKTFSDINNVDLPDIRLKSYLEYGVGLRKNFGERFSGQVEAVMRNGGRTGITMRGILNWSF